MQCQDQAPDKRPDAETIISMLNDLLSSETTGDGDSTGSEDSHHSLSLISQKKPSIEDLKREAM